MNHLRIIFMGTPEFAVASLDKLLQAGSNIVGVVTAPDKPSGRGLSVNTSAIKKFASSKKIKILQPEKLKNSTFLEELRSLKADLQIVVAFRMLPQVVWNMPPLGTINLHASLLPAYRGAAPINWVIINGEKETGITTFKLKQEIDTGDILLQKKLIIAEDETAGELYDRMKEAGAELLLKTVQLISDGNITLSPQTPQAPSDPDGKIALKIAPKISTETCRINWNQNVGQVYNLIRGLSPYPGAFTLLKEKILKIYKAKKDTIKPSIAAGEFETDNKSFLKFGCNDGYLFITEVQLEGKKKMNVEEFLRGYRF